MITFLSEVRHGMAFDQKETMSLSSSGHQQCEATDRSHVLGLPLYHDTVLIPLHHDTRIALTVSLEHATIRMIDDLITIDFGRIRGGRIVLDLTAAGPDAIFLAQITPHRGNQMSAFEAFFHALSTELDFPVSDVAWALARAVLLDMDQGAAEVREYPRFAAE